MRIAAAAAILLAALSIPGAASAQQGFNASISGDVAAGLGGGLQSGFHSGFSGALAPPTPRPRGPREEVYGPELPGAPFFPAECAPGQVNLNRTGCRPVRELSVGSLSSYDLSIQAMSPLGGTTLSGQTLTLPAGPAGPLY
ncbi:hypothetical protein [Enterovirga sp.]|jgi:hypothetical protein|uniref:hypothetical protein n=1 Tax=Enterovirga sp. TaxID=2026350 RepID=UPI00262ED66A|nr:hypothetical protein [Enterovirga sp.]MDB5590571.1 hypothetical protein [Enterovirga sp.]